MTVWADAVFIDFAANAIQLSVPGLPPGTPTTGVLDVGANGRLLGIEAGDTYIHVMESAKGEEPYIRSAEVQLTISGNPPLVTLSRRGPAYEISYPSGNECWQTTTLDGQVIQVCATIAG